MIRRRRPTREVAFSFDSFLDVVANVVGVILRLIIVAWFGAQSYKGPPVPPPPSPPAATAAVEETADAAPEPRDPLEDELDALRRDAAAARAELLEQAHAADDARRTKARAADELAAAAARREGLEGERVAAQQAAADQAREARTAEASLEEVRARMKRISEEVADLKNAPSGKHSLRCQAPVSRALQTEELFFECREGRVAVVPIGDLLKELDRDRPDLEKQLQTRWQVEGAAGPVDGFRLQYALERPKGVTDGGAVGGAAPLPQGAFSYGTSWVVEPLRDDRGEPEAAALADGSAFRRVVDALDAKQTAVTFWVYPDGFAVYRRLRDFLHDRGVVVAGRPLPRGAPIGATWKGGSASRGQ
jgi:hypothetical protein